MPHAQNYILFYIETWLRAVNQLIPKVFHYTLTSYKVQIIKKLLNRNNLGRVSVNMK